MSAAARDAKGHAAPALVACDLDRTLLDETGEPYAGIVAALATLTAAGVRVVLATGRTVAATRGAALRLGLPPGDTIAYHGAVIADLRDGRWLERHDLPPGAALALAAALLDAGAEVSAYVDDERWDQDRCDDFAAALQGVAVTRLVVGGATAELLASLAAGHPNVAVSAAPGGRLELHHAAADKATALARLCARRGVARAGAVACGDGAPDAGMLRWAGLGIAVAEGAAAARAAADLVVPRAELPGVLSGLVEG